MHFLSINDFNIYKQLHQVYPDIYATILTREHFNVFDEDSSLAQVEIIIGSNPTLGTIVGREGKKNVLTNQSHSLLNKKCFNFFRKKKFYELKITIQHLKVFLIHFFFNFQENTRVVAWWGSRWKTWRKGRWCTGWRVTSTMTRTPPIRSHTTPPTDMTCRPASKSTS